MTQHNKNIERSLSQFFSEETGRRIRRRVEGTAGLREGTHRHNGEGDQTTTKDMGVCVLLGAYVVLSVHVSPTKKYPYHLS